MLPKNRKVKFGLTGKSIVTSTESKTLNGEQKLINGIWCYFLQQASSYMANCNHKLVSLPFTTPFIYALHFSAPNKEKETSNIFLFQGLFFLLLFYSHCAVSYFGSVLWLK